LRLRGGNAFSPFPHSPFFRTGADILLPGADYFVEPDAALLM
jgi:hypothetical protein